MEGFQKTVLVIAIIFLLICLIVISLLLIKNKKQQLWPPIISNCPDYWLDLSDNGSKCVNIQNLGTCKSTTTMDFSVAPYIGSNGDSQKYNWAKGCGVTWDGVTYGVNKNVANCTNCTNTNNIKI